MPPNESGLQRCFGLSGDNQPTFLTMHIGELSLSSRSLCYEEWSPRARGHFQMCNRSTPLAKQVRSAVEGLFRGQIVTPDLPQVAKCLVHARETFTVKQN